MRLANGLKTIASEAESRLRESALPASIATFLAAAIWPSRAWPGAGERAR